MLLKQDAKWHISCFNSEDKNKAKMLMNKIYCKNYQIYNCIDDTI